MKIVQRLVIILMQQMESLSISLVVSTLSIIGSRFKYFSNQKVSPEDMAKYGVQMKPSSEVTLEKVYEEMQAMDIDSWQQVRGPRPWEENLDAAK